MPADTNPLGHYRRNPEYDETGRPPRNWPPAPGNVVPQNPVQVKGWASRERHFSPLEPSAPAARQGASPPVVPEPIAPGEPIEEVVLPGVSDVLVVNDAPTRSPADAVGARAQRLAERQAERRERTRQRIRRAGSVAAASVVVFGAMAAFGSFRGGGDGGDGAADATTLSVNAVATSGTAGAPIRPGKRGDIILRMQNPNAFAVTATRVSGGPFPGSATGGPRCTVANSKVSFTAPPALNVDIPANGNVAVRLKRAALQARGAPKACRGQTFTIPVSVTVRRSMNG